jgi:hypothetical protein
MWVPNGSFTGKAQQTNVRTIQNPTPASFANGVPGSTPGRGIAIAGFAGKTRVAANSAIALMVTTPAMYALRDLDIGAPFVRATFPEDYL